MNTKEEILSFLYKNKSFLAEKYHVTSIGLFGSFARDEQKQGSDVDLLIELDNDVSNIYDIKTSLKEYLSKSFNRSVDIAREKYLKPYAKAEILQDTMYV